MAIPMERHPLSNTKHKFTPNLLALFRWHSLPDVVDERIELFEKQFSIEGLEANKASWYQGNYRGELHSDETCQEGPGSTWTLDDLKLTPGDLRNDRERK